MKDREREHAAENQGGGGRDTAPTSCPQPQRQWQLKLEFDTYTMG